MPARIKFMRKVASGIDPERIISGAKAFAKEMEKKIGTEFIPMAKTWLNQHRWEDDPAAYAASANGSGRRETLSEQMLREAEERERV